jgi:hypothetical protein
MIKYNKEERYKEVMDRAMADNERIAERNLENARLTGEPLIDPTIEARFLEALHAINRGAAAEAVERVGARRG